MLMVGCILDKKLLVLGAGVDQIPGFLKAKEMGIYTIALDGKVNAEAFAFADESYVVSIKHIDQIEAFLNQYKERIDGVIAFGVDIPKIIAQVSDFLNINYTVGLDSAKLSEDKYLSKVLMESLGVKVPPFSRIKTVKDVEKFVLENGFPIVIKPLDNSASRGINLIDSLDYVQEAMNYAFENTEQEYLIVEKYLTGPQVSSESFVVEKELFNIGFADRNYEDMERFLPFIIENGGDMPSKYMKKEHNQKLKLYLEKIARYLEIDNGVIKGDIVIHNNELYIIEFALRLSGGNFSTIEIPESTGVDFLKIAIKLHLGLSVELKELMILKSEHLSLRYKFLEDIKSGKIKEIHFDKLNNHIISSSLFIKKGDMITNEKTMNHASRLASVIAKGKDKDDAILKANKYLNNLEIIFE